MNICTQPAVLGRWFFGAVVLLVALASTGRAQNLSGDYEDGGTPATKESGLLPCEPSLHALLRLEFDPQVMQLRRDETAHVKVTDQIGVLTIEVFDREGALSWSTRWRENESYVRKSGVVILRFQTGETDGDIILTLEAAPSGLLQVHAHRFTPTVVGPALKDLGTYLFHRAP